MARRTSVTDLWLRAEHHSRNLREAWDWVQENVKPGKSVLVAYQPFLIANRVLAQVANGEKLDERYLLSGTSLRIKSGCSSESRRAEKVLRHDVRKLQEKISSLEWACAQMDIELSSSLQKLQKIDVAECDEVEKLKLWLDMYRSLPADNHSPVFVFEKYLQRYANEHIQDCSEFRDIRRDRIINYQTIFDHWVSCTASLYTDATFGHTRRCSVDEVKANLPRVLSYMIWYKIHYPVSDCSRRGMPISRHFDSVTASCVGSFCEIMGIPYWFEPDVSNRYPPIYIEGESEDYISTDSGRDNGIDDSEDMDTEFEDHFENISDSE